jgi:hypothetical protein
MSMRQEREEKPYVRSPEMRRLVRALSWGIVQDMLAAAAPGLAGAGMALLILAVPPYFFAPAPALEPVVMWSARFMLGIALFTIVLRVHWKVGLR